MTLKMEGYSIARKDRYCNGGGVAIYILDDIPYNTRPDIDTDIGIQSVSIQINIPYTLTLSSLHVCTDNLAVTLPFSKILKHFLAFLNMNTLNF